MNQHAPVGGGPPAEERLASLLSELGESERRLAEAREAVNDARRARDLFLANMSHELRTPMTSVIGATELLLESRLDPEQRELLETVRRSGTLLLHLINDILDYSKIEAGRHELYVRDFDLHAIIRTAVHALYPVARARGLALSVDVADGVPRWVRGDPVRLEQVIRNLLDNAFKFTEEGRVALSVLADDGSARVRFVVSDTGPGFDPVQAQRLFEPFAQGDGSSSRRHGGAGLGLAIARQLVELMGGAIGVDSVPGWGSRFWFGLELPRGSEAAARKQSSTRLLGRCLSPVPRRAGNERRILLAEDNQLNQVLVKRTLEQVECVVDAVGTGAEAVEAALSGRYDAVLMDCQMPDMDGLEATREIRRREPQATRVPIIALTANAMIGDREKCLTAEMDDYIAKPFSISELRRILKRWLAGPVRAVPVQTSVGGDEAVVAPDTPLDEQRFAALRDEAGPAILAELVTIFVEDMRVRLHRLETASGLEELHRAGHAIKGAAGNLGAMRMAAIAESIEHAAGAPGDPATTRRVAELHAEFERVCAALLPGGELLATAGA